MLHTARPLRRLSVLAVPLALLVLAHGSLAGDQLRGTQTGLGSGSIELYPAFGGGLHATLEDAAGEPLYLLQAAITEVQQNSEEPGLLLAQLDGVLVDPLSHEWRGTLDGVLLVEPDGSGRWVGVLHPVSGPDPWKVDAGIVQGWIQTRVSQDGVGVPKSAGDLLPLLIEGKTLFSWTLDQPLQ